MIYHSGIDNQTADRWGINLEDAYLFTWIHGLPVWADRSVIDGKDFYHGARNSVKKALPLASDKPDTIYRQFKRMQAAGIIEHEKIGVKDYIHITPKGKEWNFAHTSEKNPTLGLDGQLSEKNPGKLGKKSESSSEKNPTYYRIKEDYNNNDKEEGANAPTPFTIEGLDPDSFFEQPNGQKTREVGTKGGGAKVKKVEVYLTDQFPTFDLFRSAWKATEYASEHADIDPRRLWDALSAWQGGGKGEPVYKDWIKAAITWANRAPHEFKYVKNGSATIGTKPKDGDSLMAFFAENRIPESGF